MKTTNILSAFILAILAILSLPMNSSPQENSSPDNRSPQSPPLPLTERIICNPVRKFAFENGLTLLVREDPSVPVVSLQAWVCAGSVTEGDRTGAGMSHILEHMLFKGTEKRGASEIARAVQAMGGSANAYTTFERTVYYIDQPSHDWRQGLDILQDAVFRSTLPLEEYEKEMEVVRREFAMGFDDPGRAMNKLLFATAFKIHPCRHPVIGHLEIFNSLSREDLLNYYHRFYTPSNAVFIVVGNIPADEVKNELGRITQDLPLRAIPSVFTPPEPDQLCRREAVEEFHTAAARMAMAYRIPGITHPDIYALDVLALLAGDGRSSRFYRKLIEQTRLLRAVDVTSYTPRDFGLWVIHSVFHPNSKTTTTEVETAIASLIDDLCNNPVSETEMEKAKRKVITDRAKELRTMSGQASAIGIGWMLAHDPDFTARYIDRVTQVTAQDLMRVARLYFRPENLSVVTLVPSGSNNQAIEQSAPAKNHPLQRIDLSSGIPLVLKCDEKVPLATVGAVIRAGLLAESRETNGIGALTARLLPMGAHERSAEQIAEQIENLGGSLSSESGNNTMTISIEVLDSGLPQALELLADIVLRPTFPHEEIEKERAKQVADIQIELDNPMAIARNRLRESLFGDHPYALNPLGAEQSLKKLTRQQLIDYHRSLIHPKGIVLTASGHINPDDIKKMFERHFPASALHESSAPKPHSPSFLGVGQTEIVPTPKQQAIVQIGFPGTDMKAPDRAPLELIHEALNDMSSRLFRRIREEQSLAYFVGATQLTGLDQGYFLLYAGTEASKGIKVRDELLHEIRQIAANGLEKEEIERARSKIVGERLMRQQNPGIVALYGAIDLIAGLPLNYEDTLTERIQSLGTQEIQETAHKYFGKNNYISVIVQPENRR